MGISVGLQLRFEALRGKLARLGLGRGGKLIAAPLLGGAVRVAEDYALENLQRLIADSAAGGFLAALPQRTLFIVDRLLGRPGFSG
jgi:hypothetical protein